MQFSSLAALVLLGFSAADDSIPSCGIGKPACPAEYPCCSVEGTCGNGYVCLGGCDPRFSNTPGSCVAMPIYNSSETMFKGTDGIAAYADYLGDAEKNAWNYLGNITKGDDNSLRVQMYKGSTGSTVYSSRYLWYGKVTFKMKTSGGAGIVSDFILLSNVKDEIDYEFVGYNINMAQTNYYWQGFENYHNMISSELLNDTMNNYHEYVIDWQEEQIQWIIDGNLVRTLKKSETLNPITGIYSYPQTPARLEFGLWPGGDAVAQGTSDWAGGKIDWNAGQGADTGYFFIDIASISVEAYDPPAGVNRTGSKSYIFTSKEGQEKDVAITDDDHILKSTDGTGEDLDGPFGHSSSSSASSSSTSSSTKANPISSSTVSSSSSTSSASSSSNTSSSSDSASSSADSSSPSQQAGGDGSNNPAFRSAGSKGPTSSSSGTSSTAASRTSAANDAGRMAIPVLAGLLPILMI